MKNVPWRKMKERLKESAWAKEQRCESAPPRAGTPCGQSAPCGTWIGSSHLVLSEMGPFVGLWENELLVLLRVFLALFPFCWPARKDQCHLAPSPTASEHWQALGVPGGCSTLVYDHRRTVSCLLVSSNQWMSSRSIEELCVSEILNYTTLPNLS